MNLAHPKSQKKGGAARGAGRSGVWDRSKRVWTVAAARSPRKHCASKGSRSYRDRSGEPVKLKKTTTTQTAIQVTVIMGVLTRSELHASLEPFSVNVKPTPEVVSDNFNHGIILHGSLAHVHGARGSFHSVLWYCHEFVREFSRELNKILIPPNVCQTPKSGIISRASLKRLVKFATQITSVSSTICPSSKNLFNACSVAARIPAAPRVTRSA
jgi:hypothetical protein